ncbi:MAG: hypothetical protein ABH827_00740 [bacterium]
MKKIVVDMFFLPQRGILMNTHFNAHKTLFFLTGITLFFPTSLNCSKKLSFSVNGKKINLSKKTSPTDNSTPLDPNKKVCNFGDHNQYSEIFFAIHTRNLLNVQKVVEKDKTVITEKKYDTNETPLLYAIQKCCPKIVIYLLKQGADPFETVKLNMRGNYLYRNAFEKLIDADTYYNNSKEKTAEEQENAQLANKKLAKIRKSLLIIITLKIGQYIQRLSGPNSQEIRCKIKILSTYFNAIIGYTDPKLKDALNTLHEKLKSLVGTNKIETELKSAYLYLLLKRINFSTHRNSEDLAMIKYLITQEPDKNTELYLCILDEHNPNI